MSLKSFRKDGKKIWKKKRHSPKEKNFGNDNWSLGRARMQARKENRIMKKLARRYDRREAKRKLREEL